MRFIIPLIIVILLLPPPSTAQQDPRFSLYQKDIDSIFVPSSATAAPGIAGTQTVYLNELDLTNITSSDVFCTVQDNQSPAKVLLPNVVPVAAGKILVLRFGGRKMTNGITWSCGTGSAVVGWIQYSTGRT